MLEISETACLYASDIDQKRSLIRKEKETSDSN